MKLTLHVCDGSYHVSWKRGDLELNVEVNFGKFDIYVMDIHRIIG